MSTGKLVSSTGLRSEINFDQKNLTKADRTQSAAKWFGIFFACAVFSVFVPILHFILVPSFLFAAFFVSWKAFNKKADLTNVRGLCPNCQKPIVIEKVRIKKVTGEICPNCRDFLKIHLE